MKIDGKAVRLFLIILVIGALLLLFGAEVAVRWMGLADFPVYRADADIGYILAPDQHGAFLDKNHWSYNEKSQGAGPWSPNGKTDLLLLGDSLVLGGNPVDQPQRLGPQLNLLLPGWQVWPASAGSWAILNEIAYLHRFPEVANDVSALVWVVNTGDLEPASVWKSELTHPRSHPISALWYVFNKYVLLPHFWKGDPDNLGNAPTGQILPAAMAGLQTELQTLRSQKPGRKVLFVFYPDQEEETGAKPETVAFYDKFRTALLSVVATDGDPVLELRKDPRWNVGLYRDSIHPSVAGNRVFAQIIADRLRQQGVP